MICSGSISRPRPTPKRPAPPPRSRRAEPSPRSCTTSGAASRLSSFDKAGLPQQPRLIGVSEDTRQGVATGKWKAQIDRGDGLGTQHIGVYRTAKQAALAYDKQARLLNRPTNFKK